VSIRLRLTLLFVAALALLAALGSVATYLVVSDNLHARGRDTGNAPFYQPIDRRPDLH